MDENKNGDILEVSQRQAQLVKALWRRVILTLKNTGVLGKNCSPSQMFEYA